MVDNENLDKKCVVLLTITLVLYSIPILISLSFQYDVANMANSNTGDFQQLEKMG